MEVSYNKLWKLMIDKGMPNKSDLRFTILDKIKGLVKKFFFLCKFV